MTDFVVSYLVKLVLVLVLVTNHYKRVRRKPVGFQRINRFLNTMSLHLLHQLGTKGYPGTNQKADYTQMLRQETAQTPH